jgi:hypothetical protein
MEANAGGKGKKGKSKNLKFDGTVKSQKYADFP